MGKEAHLNKLIFTYDEVRSENIQCFIERIKYGFVVNFLILKVCFFGTGKLLMTHVINFLIKFLKDIFRNNIFKAIYNPIFILFKTFLIGIALKHLDSLIHVVTKGHIDQS